LRLKGKTVRLGILAPSSIPILREELVGTEHAAASHPMETPEPAARLPHSVRNKLNTISLALHLYQKQLDRGLITDAERTFGHLLREFDALEKEAAASVGSRSFEKTHSPNGHSALVVEDDRNECELLAGFLRVSGYEVVTADDGEDALGYLSSHEMPDVVLLDMMMPRCDGPTMINALRKNPRFEDLKVVAISGSSPAQFGITVGPHGIDRWFPKPVNPELLVRELNRDLARTTPLGNGL
jgi:CheY-like chemotaxis protein